MFGEYETAAHLGKRPRDDEQRSSNARPHVQTPVEQTPCVYFARGTCTNENCPYLHSQEILSTCYQCGETGHFARDCASRRPPQPGSPFFAAPIPRTPCAFYLKGLCKNGLQCTFLHPRLTTSTQQVSMGGSHSGTAALLPKDQTLCVYYQRGACTKTDCQFLHPQAPGFRLPRPQEFVQRQTPPTHIPKLPKDQTPCVYFQRGVCTKLNCEFLHQQVSMIPQRPAQMPTSRNFVAVTTPSSMLPKDQTPCVYYQRGSCNKPDCQFLHEEPKGSMFPSNGSQVTSQGTLLPKDQTPCVYFQRGMCIKTDCQFKHCFDDSMMQTTTQPSAPLPEFIAPQSGAAATTADAVTRNSCKYFQQGTCTKGTNCSWSHE